MGSATRRVESSNPITTPDDGDFITFGFNGNTAVKKDRKPDSQAQPSDDPGVAPEDAAGDVAGGSANGPESTVDPQRPAGEDAIEIELSQKDGGLDLIGKFPSLARITSVLVLLAGILIVGLLFYKVMIGFFIPLFMAAAMVVIFRPVNEWILQKLNGRRGLAAAATSSLILAIVLIPVLTLVSIAIGQLTGLVSRTDLDDIKSALDRARQRFGLELDHADRFRRLDALAGMLDQVDRPDLVLAQVVEAEELILFLDPEVESVVATEEVKDNAIRQLNKLAATAIELQRLAEAGPAADGAGEKPQPDLSAIRSDEAIPIVAADSPDEAARRIAAEEDFHRQSVIASAAIASWMNTKLGGSFRTQAKLFFNPSEKDLAAAVRSVREYLQPRFVKLSGVTGRVVVQTLVGMLIMIISIYFFFVDGPAMVGTLMRLSPLDDSYERRLLGEFERTSRAVVLASVLSALAQGVLAAVAYILCGFESYILLFLITTVMALVPFLGAASVWVPSALYLAVVDQRYLAAVLLAVYGAAVVSSIDNVIKAYVLHGHSELHPLVALLSVLGGVPVFGPIGILIGPMVVVFLQTLLEILNQELGRRETPQQPEAS